MSAGTVQSVYIIAEAGVNHNGCLEKARQLVDVAVEAGADAVKFQTFKAENLLVPNTPKAPYQNETTGCEHDQYEMIKALELSAENHEILYKYCKEQKIDFLSTPFDNESLEFLLENFDMPHIKISSSEITNAPMILKAALSGRKIILSTGMSTLEEIKDALSVIAFAYDSEGADKKPSANNFQRAYEDKKNRALLKEKVTLLHCVSEYPAPYESINLRAMETLREVFDVPVGYSDHSLGIEVPVAAVALAAPVIEKHFTLDKNLPGPDHRASLSPEELKEMVQSIRRVERALGNGKKEPHPCESKNILFMRKSLVARKSIQKGQIITEEDVTTKRPADGISPMKLWELLGSEANQSYEANQKIILSSE